MPQNQPAVVLLSAGRATVPLPLLLKLSLTFTFVLRLCFGRLISKELCSPLLRLVVLFFPLFIAEMYKDAPQRETYCGACRQKNNA